jgi:hypothetical protein
MLRFKLLEDVMRSMEGTVRVYYTDNVTKDQRLVKEAYCNVHGLSDIKACDVLMEDADGQLRPRFIVLQ